MRVANSPDLFVTDRFSVCFVRLARLPSCTGIPSFESIVQQGSANGVSGGTGSGNANKNKTENRSVRTGRLNCGELETAVQPALTTSSAAKLVLQHCRLQLAL